MIHTIFRIRNISRECLKCPLESLCMKCCNVEWNSKLKSMNKSNFMHSEQEIPVIPHVTSHTDK